jgi:hypothetical protein
MNENYFKNYYEINKEKILSYGATYNQNKYNNMTEDEKRAYIERAKLNVKKRRERIKNSNIENGIIIKKGRPKKYNL